MAINDDRAVADLPHVLGAFIGRAGEIAEILPLLATARLFTLTGMGGSGKTRLAAQVAAQSSATFRNGVQWVDPALPAASRSRPPKSSVMERASPRSTCLTF